MLFMQTLSLLAVETESGPDLDTLTASVSSQRATRWNVTARLSKAFEALREYEAALSPFRIKEVPLNTNPLHRD